jgi:hypothetical protein
MMVTGLSLPTCGRSNCMPSTPAKISSNRNCGGAWCHACMIPSRSAASPQQTSAGVLSFIIETSSAGAWREYRGTTIRPSAIKARSIATQRMLFAASSPQRSPLLNPFEAIKVLALRISSNNSPPVTPVIWPSRISAMMRVPAASRSCENISPMNGMGDVIASIENRYMFQTTAFRARSRPNVAYHTQRLKPVQFLLSSRSLRHR